MTSSQKLDVLKTIKNHLKSKYKIVDKESTISITTFKIILKYDFNVSIIVSIDRCYANDASTNFTIIVVCNGKHKIYADARYISYLNEIDICLDKLMEQINTYEEFIKGFTDSVVDDLYNVECHINLNTLHTYFKSDNGRAVIYPAIELGHGGEYVTMYIDSIDGGNYPMKIYSSISFDDAKGMLDFYL